MSFVTELHVVDPGNYGHYRPHDDKAQWSVTCPSCGSATMLMIAFGKTPRNYAGRPDFSIRPNEGAAWLMCLACGMGAFAIGTPDEQRLLHPKAEPFGTPANLSDAVQTTWNEALKSFSASAFTSCALICRKIIFHMAVEAGLPEKDDRGWSPGFEECVDHLVAVGHISRLQKNQWVDSIRRWGNTATHELNPVDEATAYSILQFTFQLLQMVYAFPDAANGERKELSAVPEKPQLPRSSGDAATPSRS